MQAEHEQVGSTFLHRRRLLPRDRGIMSVSTLCGLHFRICFGVVSHICILIDVSVSDPEDGSLGEEYDGGTKPDPLR